MDTHFSAAPAEAIEEFAPGFSSGSLPTINPTLTLPLVSFVIPTLNEAKNLPHLLPRIPEWAYEVIIIDGRSADDTVEVARQLRPDVRIVMEPRRGKVPRCKLDSGLPVVKSSSPST